MHRSCKPSLALFLSLALLALSMLSAAPARGGATFDILGLLPGQAESEANSVSADGSVVAGFSGTGAETVGAFRWTRATGMQALPTPPAPGYSYAVNVSEDGS